ncbi:MAG: DNA-processing protein DprA [Pseudomonadota bacterium]
MIILQNSLFFKLVLHRLPEVGAATYAKLLHHFGTAETVLMQPANDLEKFLTANALSAIAEFQHDHETSTIGQKALMDLDWLNGQANSAVITYEDPRYPALLQQIPKPPPLLFVRGDVTCLSLPQIAIVGSRNPSSGGLENAQRFAQYLSGNGFVITSGLAAGIDAAAHEGALMVQGKTIAIMGTGIDKVYPAPHRELAQRIMDNGGTLVSEFPLGTGAQAANFPQRNRIISGLSYGVLVVEAAVKSGSLITAKIALQQDREVFAIPGSIHNPLARGCHQLIRQGATLVETGSDIVEQLDGMLSYQRQELLDFQKSKKPSQPRENTTPKPQLVKQSLEELSVSEQQLMEAIGFDPVSIDELVERTGHAIGLLMGQLVGLEIKGFIQQLGATYQRV